MSDLDSYGHLNEASFGDYVRLLKPRVMSLVVFTALVGLVVAPGDLGAIEILASVVFIALGAGASGALNMWWDADIDAVMRRTRGRPVPAGKVDAQEALALGLGLAGISVVMLGLAANALAAALLAFAIFFYAVIYSMLLKRSTPWNIVIGGAAGAFPPVIGWACAAGNVSLEALLMFALTFMWTPPHFWALALFTKDDYSNAGIPMLTVTHGRKETRWQILLYTLLLVPVALWAALSALGGPLTLAVALGLNGVFLLRAYAVWRRDEVQAEADGYRAERRMFRFSLIYLFVMFAAFAAERVLAAYGLGGW